MIYVIEFPEQGRAHAWFAFEKQDLIRKIYAADTRPEWEIYDVVTPRESLEIHGKTPETVRDELPARLSGRSVWMGHAVVSGGLSAGRRRVSG